MPLPPTAIVVLVLPVLSVRDLCKIYRTEEPDGLPVLEVAKE